MFDVLIVGAGPSGLCAAKTILECDDGVVNLRLVDSNKTIGGVWAKENLYPGLRTNNLHGAIDYTDFPMHQGFGINRGEHVTGEAMHEYFKQYAQKWDILRRIDYETSVIEISRLEHRDGWNVKVEKKAADGNITTVDLETKKLIIATGIANRPHRPLLEGTSDFKGTIFHSAELGLKSGSLMKDPQVQRIAVLGGGKSAYDAVYLAACNGKQVDWIIRRSGKGPVWVFPSHTMLGPFRAWREKLVLRRIISCFSPCFWEDGMGLLRKFFHATSFGKKIAQMFWHDLHMATLDDCRYAKDPAFNILEPETSPFWYGTTAGAFTYNPDLFSFIKSGQVRCHREDIASLTPTGVQLGNGIHIPCEALVTATGYSVKPTMTFSPPSSHSDLGIPSTSLTPDQRSFWRTLNEKAEDIIATHFPRLLSGPFLSPSSSIPKPFNPGVDPNARYTPFRLYRSIAPPGPTSTGDRSLVFIGMFNNIANTIRLELQCLWAYAYLNNALPINQTKVYDEAALTARYARYRSPYGHGRYFPDIVFDQLPYFDVLLQDLGLPFWRKKGWAPMRWWKEVFWSYGQEDYEGVVREWKGKYLQELRQRKRMEEKNMAWGTEWGEIGGEKGGEGEDEPLVPKERRVSITLTDQDV